jgi:ATP-binding cassette subfamily B protein
LSDLGERRTVSLRRIFELAKPEVRILSVATVALLLASGLSLTYPQALRWMVDSVVSSGDLQQLDRAVIALVTLFFLQAVFATLRAWLFTVAGERIVAHLRGRLYQAIVTKDIAFFDREKTGELTNRLASDTTVLQNTVTVNLSMALRFAVGAVGSAVLLVWMSPSLAGLAMVVVPVVALAAAMYGRLIRRLSRQVQDALAESTDVAQETFAGIRTVRSFAREPQESSRYAQAVDRSYQLAAKRALAIGVFTGVAGFAGFTSIGLVIWYGGRLVLDPAVAFTMGDLTAFLLYTMMGAVSLGQLSNLYGDFMRAAGSSERIFELLDQAAEIESADGDDLDLVQGHLTFDGVQFAYPSRPDVIVLDDFDLDLSPGQVAALVGPSGSGKSTVSALLARFYDPQRGRITLDGRDIRELRPGALREEIGTVAQEPILFATSIADNIRYGRPGASLKEVMDAARTANAHDFVEAFPEGYDTLVGERGVRLSGGQKQRVAIARAVLKNPRILVLDEATSALDAANEQVVQDALDRLMQGRTTLIIAHRLSTIRSADRIVVLDQGRVAEAGSHGELMARPGVYRRLVERQLGGVDVSD